jgi:hypothetical protein
MTVRKLTGNGKIIGNPNKIWRITKECLPLWVMGHTIDGKQLLGFPFSDR